jgi:hypothetical protein
MNRCHKLDNHFNTMKQWNKKTRTSKYRLFEFSITPFLKQRFIGTFFITSSKHHITNSLGYNQLNTPIMIIMFPHTQAIKQISKQEKKKKHNNSTNHAPTVTRSHIFRGKHHRKSRPVKKAKPIQSPTATCHLYFIILS